MALQLMVAKLQMDIFFFFLSTCRSRGENLEERLKKVYTYPPSPDCPFVLLCCLTAEYIPVKSDFKTLSVQVLLSLNYFVYCFGLCSSLRFCPVTSAGMHWMWCYTIRGSLNVRSCRDKGMSWQKVNGVGEGSCKRRNRLVEEPAGKDQWFI